jgi:hypothetical protein
MLPAFVVEGLPDVVVAVGGDRVSDLQIADSVFDVHAIMLEGELGLVK